MSGTVASRSSPESAGTGAFLAGSTFIAIVPPVANRTTAGLSCALASVASRYRRVASGSFSIAVTADLRVECLVHEIVEGPAKPWWIVLQAARQVLHHQDRDQFLPRIDREPRCSSAAPTELADGAGLPAAYGIEHDGAAET